MKESAENTIKTNFRSYNSLTDEEKALLSDEYLYNPELSPQEIERHVANVAEHGLFRVFLDTVDFRTPLHVACRKGLENLALEMVKQGAPLDVRKEVVLQKRECKRLAGVRFEEDFIYSTPLHVACQLGLESVALEMIRRGAPLDGKSSFGNTPLHFAMKNGLERAALEMIKRGALLKQDDVTNTPYGEVLQSESFHDMLDQFINHCILPIYALEKEDVYHIRNILRKLVIDRLFQVPEAPKKISELRTLDENSLFVQDYFRPMRLSRTWHHATIQFPHELIPLRRKREWHPILHKNESLKDGVYLTCLATTDMLEEESQKLNHCVGRSDYDIKCCAENTKERSHILSIRDANGKPLSTLEVKLVQKQGPNDIPIGATGMFMHIEQHHGRNDKAPPPIAIKAWKEFCVGIEKGNIVIEKDSAKLGETQASKNTSRESELTELIGFKVEGVPPDKVWEQASKCFDEFRKDNRRGTLDRPDSEKRVHDDVITEDGYLHEQNHFISGYALVNADHSPTGQWALHKEELKPEAGQNIVDLRTLSFKSWLRATGLLNELLRSAPRNDCSPLIEQPIPRPVREQEEEQNKENKDWESRFGNDAIEKRGSGRRQSTGFVRH